MRISSGRLHLLALSLKELGEFEELNLDDLAYKVNLKSEVFTRDLFEEVIQAAIFAGLVNRSEVGSASLSGIGRRLLNSTAINENYDLQRRILRRVILSTRRDLVRLAFSGLDEFRLRPSDELECFEQLGLADYRLSEEAIRWWSSIQSAGAEFDSGILKSLGDRAELASIRFEEERLKGYLSGDRKVDWVSRDTDLAGFDILSYSGHQPDPMTRVPIEVKKLSRDNEGAHYFYLSRNEFEVASKTPGYRFHLWEIAPDGSSANLWIPKLANVLLASPVDKAPGKWESCTIFLSSLQDSSSRQAF